MQVQVLMQPSMLHRSQLAMMSQRCCFLPAAPPPPPPPGRHGPSSVGSGGEARKSTTQLAPAPGRFAAHRGSL